MTLVFSPKTTGRLLGALVALLLAVTTTTAQDEAQTIRNLIKLESEGTPIKVTNDVVYWPGVVDQPVVGKQAWEAKRQELMKNRPNTKFNRVPERLVVAESKELAYEYGYQTTSWGQAGGESGSTKGYYMRVWRKVNGEWLLEGFFARLTEQN